MFKRNKLTRNQRKWVKALRSGEYEQGEGQLQKGDKFCCLGVAADVARKDGVDVEINEYGGEILGTTLSNQCNVIEYLGLQHFAGRFNADDHLNGINALWKLNDGVSWTFDQIADFIESNPDGLFVERISLWQSIKNKVCNIIK